MSKLERRVECSVGYWSSAVFNLTLALVGVCVLIFILVEVIKNKNLDADRIRSPQGYHLL